MIREHASVQAAQSRKHIIQKQRSNSMMSSTEAIRQSNNQLLSNTIVKVMGHTRKPSSRPMSSYGKPPMKKVPRKRGIEVSKKPEISGQNSVDLSADSLYRYTIGSPVNMVSNTSSIKMDLSHRPLSGVKIEAQKPVYQKSGVYTTKSSKGYYISATHTPSLKHPEYNMT